MAYDATPGQGSAPAVPIGDPQPYHRLLRNSRSQWWTPILGSLTILAGWMFTSVVILSIQMAIRVDPKGTVVLARSARWAYHFGAPAAPQLATTAFL